LNYFGYQHDSRSKNQNREKKEKIDSK